MIAREVALLARDLLFWAVRARGGSGVAPAYGSNTLSTRLPGS